MPWLSLVIFRKESQETTSENRGRERQSTLFSRKNQLSARSELIAVTSVVTSQRGEEMEKKAGTSHKKDKFYVLYLIDL
jgi:hypothetical protein